MSLDLPKDPAQRLHIQLDWQAYFKRFCEAHGGEPLEYKGRLLFRDGWQYSNSDYAGPEFAPPIDLAACLALRVTYWRRRREAVALELYELENSYQGLQQLQAKLTAPLQCTIRYENDEGKSELRTEDINFEMMAERLSWLRSDIQDCNTHLSELSHGEATERERQAYGEHTVDAPS